MGRIVVAGEKNFTQNATLHCVPLAGMAIPAGRTETRYCEAGRQARGY